MTISPTTDRFCVEHSHITSEEFTENAKHFSLPHLKELISQIKQDIASFEAYSVDQKGELNLHLDQARRSDVDLLERVEKQKAILLSYCQASY